MMDVSAGQLPDWSDPAALGAPHAGYQRLLREAPVSWSDAVGGWLVVGHRQVIDLFGDGRLSAEGPRAFMSMLDEAAATELAPLREFYAHWMVFSDDPYHAEVRSKLIKAWAAKEVEAWRPLVRESVAAQFAAVGEGVFDAVADLTRPLSNSIICQILAIPERDRALVDEWSANIIAFIVTPRPIVELGRRAQASVAELEEYAWKLAQDPHHVLAPVLPVGRVAVAATLAQLLTGGTDPLSAALASMVLQTATAHQPQPATKSVVDESLRLSCPFTLAPRIAKEDMVLAGRDIRAGEMVNLVLAAANRDPEAFANPDDYDPQRTEQAQHLAFGVGRHYCLGASLARMVMAEFHEELTRTPFVQAGEAVWLPAFGIRTLLNLPVRRI